MSERPTPETDAAIREIPESGHYSALILRVVSAHIARKLERERDEARKLSRTLADTLHDAHKRLNSFLNRPGGAMALRDSMLVAKCERALAEAKEVLP